jgi:hypothetical protein
MRHQPLLVIFATSALTFSLATTVHAQAKPPVISNREFKEGSARLTVTGSFAFVDTVAINKMASFADGEETWLMFGNSGSTDPGVAITYSESGETGVTISKGKMTATAGIIIGEKSECTGKVAVTPTLVSGNYTCVGVTSYDPVTGKMGTVKIDVVFTAKS